MSRGYNKIILMGNLARDPDVRYTPNKQKVARITVAVGREWKKRDTNEKQSHTDFINVVCWQFLADLCDSYLKKGRPVHLEGRLSVRDYYDQKTGQRKWTTEVIAENIVLLPSAKRSDEPANPDGFSGYQNNSDYSDMGDMGSLRDEQGFADDLGSGDVEIPF